MSKFLQSIGTVAGRVLLSLIFLMSGVGKIFDLENTKKYMEAKGMTNVAFFLTMAILFEIAGAVLVMVGYKARLGALLLIAFLIPATVIFHDFWAFPDQQPPIEMIMFMKNLSILGGLLIVLARGPGPMSIDAWRSVGGEESGA